MRTGYYTSQDIDQNRQAMESWSVYAEQYPNHLRDSVPIDGSQRLVARGLPTEAAALAFVAELRRVLSQRETN